MIEVIYILNYFVESRGLGLAYTLQESRGVPIRFLLYFHLTVCLLRLKIFAEGGLHVTCEVLNTIN
jgi:hypothetical protein